MLPEQKTLRYLEEVSLETSNPGGGPKGRWPSGWSGVLSGAHLFHESLPFKGPAVVLVNVLFLPVLGVKGGGGEYLDVCPLHFIWSNPGSPTPWAAPLPCRVSSSSSEGHLDSLSKGPPIYQGVVEDLPEVWVQVVCVIPGSGQETAKFMLIAEVKEDALEWGEGVRRTPEVAASYSPALGLTAPLTLSRRLLQKAMSGSVSLPENTSLCGSSVLRVSPRITYAWEM